MGSSWQNGRIERFWRTLKEGVLEKREPIKEGLIAIKTQFKFANLDAMTQTLAQFQRLYNTQRPHQSLRGKTPAMVWEAGREKALQKQAARAPPWLPCVNRTEQGFFVGVISTGYFYLISWEGLSGVALRVVNLTLILPAVICTLPSY